MEADRAPDETIRLTIDGHNVLAYSFGTGPEVLFCMSGGPGAPCDYVRDSHSHLADHGYRVVIHDQLGTGASDRPKDKTLWRVERFVAEVETVRTALGLGKVHLLGQSWGGMLAPGGGFRGACGLPAGLRPARRRYRPPLPRARLVFA
jgi:proline iminopeptidase